MMRSFLFVFTLAPCLAVLSLAGELDATTLPLDNLATSSCSSALPLQSSREKPNEKSICYRGDPESNQCTNYFTPLRDSTRPENKKDSCSVLDSAASRYDGFLVPFVKPEQRGAKLTEDPGSCTNWDGTPCRGDVEETHCASFLVPFLRPIRDACNSIFNGFPTEEQLKNARAYLRNEPNGTVFFPKAANQVATYGKHIYLKDNGGTVWHAEAKAFGKGNNGCVRKAFRLRSSLKNGGFPKGKDIYVLKESRVSGNPDHKPGVLGEVRALRDLDRLLTPDALIVRPSEDGGVHERVSETKPNIYGKYENGDEAKAYFVQTFIPGNVLSFPCRYQRREHQDMIEREAVKALDRLHSVGRIHFDLHEHNLLIQPVYEGINIVDFKVEIVDFGNSYGLEMLLREQKYPYLPKEEVRDLCRTLRSYFGRPCFEGEEDEDELTKGSMVTDREIRRR